MNTEQVKNYLDKMNIPADEACASAFVHYYEMLTEWNKVMNLTAITAPEEVLVKHFGDSLSPCMPGGFTPLRDALPKGPVSLLDVGTGAGFPAIPLKIAFPELRITMIDSLGKRIKFLNEVIGELGLTDIRAFHGRAEDLAQDKNHREHYDFVVSRAVAHMSVLAEYCLPYVSCGGFFIAYKSQEYSVGNEAGESQNAVRLLGGEAAGLQDVLLPESDAQRCLVYIKKQKNSPKKYPRKAGLPSKEPLR